MGLSTQALKTATIDDNLGTHTARKEHLVKLCAQFFYTIFTSDFALTILSFAIVVPYRGERGESAGEEE